jgi:hypothetical protein
MAVVAVLGLRPPYVPVVIPPMPTPSPLLFHPVLVFTFLTPFFLAGAQLAKRVLVRLMHGRSDGKMLREGFDRWRAQHRMAVVAFDAACAQEELEQELEVGGRRAGFGGSPGTAH